jgi:hypothetical protein
LHLKAPSDQPVAAVLYPLLKEEPLPRFTVLAGGRAVKVESPLGTDIVMLALESFRLQSEGIDFDGKAGVIQIRPKGVHLSLPCRGKLTYRDKSLENPGNAGRSVSR